VSEAVISCQVNATETRDLRSFKRARPVRLRPSPSAVRFLQTTMHEASQHSQPLLLSEDIESTPVFPIIHMIRAVCLSHSSQNQLY
jgi:hypothetical protein